MSASMHTWMAAGSPEHPYRQEDCKAVCATCADVIQQGIRLREIETPSTANHADYFRFGSQHVCVACAWLFSAGKGRPGNYIATPGRMEYTVISLDSVVLDKRPWIEVLPEIAKLPPSTPVAAVMTTDVKPRLWPRVRLTTVERFGLYLHVGDYDVSEWREFNLSACLDLIEHMILPLKAGYAKSSLYHGLFRDHGRSHRDPAAAMLWDGELAHHRHQPHFLPALIAAGITKESKQDVQPPARPFGYPKSSSASSHQPDPPQLGLF